MATISQYPQPLNAQPEFIPYRDLPDFPVGANPPGCFVGGTFLCSSCPAPRVGIRWGINGTVGFDSSEDLADGAHSIWALGIAEWVWESYDGF